MSEYKNKTEKEIYQLLNDKIEALRKYNFSISGGKTRNVMEGRNLRKEIARLLTEFNSRKISSPKI